MTLPVLTTPEADSQIREIEFWWRRNRPAAPDLFLTELSEAFDLLADKPSLGRVYRQSPVHGVRRLILNQTRYHLYYLARNEAVWILAVWHAQRGVGPPLRTL